jgi:type VI secretion system protein ImpJ
MTYENFLPDAVQWSEGMLLSPQHFQQYDIYAQALLHQRAAGLSAHAWGVRAMAIDQAPLVSGTISVTAFEGVMPDGLPVVWSQGDGRAPKPLEVGSLCTRVDKALRIWLAVPPRAGAMETPSTSIARYDGLPGAMTIDEVTGIGDVVVERARVHVALFAEAQRPAGYPGIPLMEVMRNAQGEIVATGFHPPMLRLGASAFLGADGLMQRFAALRDKFWEKLRELVSIEQDDTPEAMSSMGAAMRAHLVMARNVAACLPLLDAVLCDPLVAPARAWQVLAQVVGCVTAIGSNPRPLVMEPYRHEDCRLQFLAAIDFVQRKLELINTDWDNLAFARVSDGVFARRLPKNAGRMVYIELRPRDGQTVRELQSWLTDALIASEDLLPVLRQRRLAGAQRRMLTVREANQIGLRSEAIVCELSSRKIERPQLGIVDCFSAGRSMLVHGSSEGAPAAIVMHLRKRGPTTAQGTEPLEGMNRGDTVAHV